MNRRSTKTGFLLVLFGLFPGCLNPRARMPLIREIYRRSAKIEARNPVVVVHGILGSRLVKRSTGENVWGAFRGTSLDPSTPEGIRSIALPLDFPRSAFEYRPGKAEVYAAGPLDVLELDFLFSTVSVQVYSDILGILGIGGYAEPPSSRSLEPEYAQACSCFTFFYDWRRDCVENALALGRFLQLKRREVQETVRGRIKKLRSEGGGKALARARELEAWLQRGFRFDIVAHSMGALISRYLCRFGMQDLPSDGSTPEVTWAGSKEIDRLILVAPPNLGAVESFTQLLEGYAPSTHLPSYPPAVVGTMPSLYQLLPRERHGVFRDPKGGRVALPLFDPRVWKRNRWGLLAEGADSILRILLPGIEDPGERRHRAERYLAWALGRAEQFHRALDAIPGTPSPTRIYLFAGDAEPTPTYVELSGSPGYYRPRKLLKAQGDGTVARYSALADEREGRSFQPFLQGPVPWTHVTFLSDDHLGLTRNPHFVDNMLYLLLEVEPRPPKK